MHIWRWTDTAFGQISSRLCRQFFYNDFHPSLEDSWSTDREVEAGVVVECHSDERNELGCLQKDGDTGSKHECIELEHAVAARVFAVAIVR